MIPYLLASWFGQLAMALFGLWFLNGLRKAIWKPRVTYVSHRAVPKAGTLLTVKRQQLMPPWMLVEETWLLDRGIHYNHATRESDGRSISDNSNGSIWDYTLVDSLSGVLVMRLAREAADKVIVADLDKVLAEEERLARTIEAASRKAAN